MKTRITLSLTIILAAGLSFYWLMRQAPAGARNERINEKPQVAVATPPPQPSAITMPPPAVLPTQAASSPVVGAATRKFSSIPALERSALLLEIRKQNLADIFKMWLEAGRTEHDLMKQSALATTLAFAMRERAPDPELLDQMRAFLDDQGHTVQEKRGVLGVLTAAATKESVDLLLLAATSLSDEELRRIAISDVAQVGIAEGAGPKLSPALERVWRESDDRALLISTAETMAKIGSPSSVELLLTSALQKNGNDAAREIAARSALGYIYKASAVPPLAALLAGQSPESEPVRLAAPLLTKIGDRTAAAVLLDWLRGSEADASALIQELLLPNTRTPAMLAAWESAVAPAISFRNERNREAIRVALAKREAGRKFQ